MEDILIGEGDGWPTNYYHGFDEPMAVIATILTDAETWELAICWPEVLSGWKDAKSWWACLESIDCSSSAYAIFKEIHGCSIKESPWDAGASGLSGCWISVFVKPGALKRALATQASPVAWRTRKIACGMRSSLIKTFANWHSTMKTCVLCGIGLLTCISHSQTGDNCPAWCLLKFYTE